MELSADRSLPTLLVIGGPTASGKTSLAISLARHFQSVILSADSRQFYKEMDIGVARPSEEELAAARHYFIADRSIQSPLSAGQYAEEALQLLDKLFQDHSLVVVVGGSGLYLQALLEGFDQLPEVPPSVRKQVDDLYARGGLDALQRAVADADPAYYALVDRNNPARLSRALSVTMASGLPYSSFRTGQKKSRPFNAYCFFIDHPKEQLHQRINQRVWDMAAAGLEQEARRLYEFRQLMPLQTVGYQEIFDYLEGKYDLPTAIQQIAVHTRQYAKRQLTWIRRMTHWHPLIPSNALQQVLRELELSFQG
jgi:tRNA dimethylallyltransferase